MNIYLLNINFSQYQHIEYFTSYTKLVYKIENISIKYLNSECEVSMLDNSEDNSWGTMINSGVVYDILNDLNYEFKIYKLKLS